LDVDLDDLMRFVEDTPWLWVACWKLEEINASMMMSGSEQQMQQSMMLVPESEAVIFAQSQAEVFIPAETGIQLDSVSVPVVEEKSIAQQIADLQDSIEFLEQIWNQEPDIQQEIDAEGWQEFMNSVKNSLLELQTEAVQIE
jgi:hypothetical protein